MSKKNIPAIAICTTICVLSIIGILVFGLLAIWSPHHAHQLANTAILLIVPAFLSGAAATWPGFHGF